MSMRSSRPTTAEVRGPILDFFKKRSPLPVLIGFIATELKVSLAEAEGYLEDLAHEGVVRVLSNEECRKFGITHGYVKG